MTEEQIRANRILDETVGYFDLGNRGFDSNNSCQYYTNDGRMCAVGRYLIDPQSFPFEGDVVSISELLDKYLRPEARGIQINFWERLQRLHDTEEHWDHEGISKRGLACAKNIRNEFGL